MSGSGLVPAPAVGDEVLGERYWLHEPIGRGGMSVVYRGYDEVLDRPVAVKMLAGVDDPRLRSLLQAEARACGKLNDPRIAQIFDYGETADADGAPAPYIVMELVAGAPLSRRLVSGTPMPWQTACSICWPIAQALSVAHARGLVHRDIKPDNVLITDDGVKLVDFGISALIGSPDADEDGNLLGTPSYVAPERIADAPVGPAADVYSLGVLLYRMLTGSMPWAADSRTQLLEAHVFTDPAPLPPVDGLPDEVAALCMSSLAKDPHERPTSIDASRILKRASRLRPPDVTAPTTVDATMAALPDGPMPTMPNPAGEEPTGGIGTRRRPWVFAGSLAAVAAVLLVVAWATGATPPPVAVSDPTQCRVALHVLRDWGTGFTAQLAVTDTASTPVNGWQLDFAFPSAQHLDTDPTSGSQTAVSPQHGGRYMVTMTQSGPNVTARAGAGQILEPGMPAALLLHAQYSGSNLLPTTFSLNGHTCRTQVAGATATTPPAPATAPAATHPVGPAPSTPVAATPGNAGPAKGHAPNPPPKPKKSKKPKKNGQ